MSQTLSHSDLTISETGLKLIKAFEGYRPVDRELITGQRIVGYGHRLYSEDAVMMDKADAEAVLRSDLEPFEDMINSEVHAPITQSQFDALCSFAFNIGPKAFLESDTLRALNNGRPLDAANGLDIWRKSEIAGKTYVVDALMRRRTAEKALFLRTDRNLPAGREDLPPVKDTTIVGLSTEDALPVFSAEDANGVVATAPHDAVDAQYRRREDGPAGALQLSERDVIEVETPWVDDNGSADESALERALKTGSDTDLDLVDTSSAEKNLTDLVFDEDVVGDTLAKRESKPSPIAAAATDIVARLDALIDDADARFEERDADWPETLIQSELTDSEDAEGWSDVETPAVDRTDDRVVSGIERGASEAEVIDLRQKETPEESEEIQLPYQKPQGSRPITVIDELAQDDAIRVRTDSAAKYIQSRPPAKPTIPVQEDAGWGLWIPVILGFVLLGAAAATLFRGAEALLGAWGPIIAFTGLVIGVGLILVGIYTALRINSRR